MLKKRLLQLLFSLVVSGVFIWYAARGVDVARVVELLRTADYTYVIPGFGVCVVLQLVRVWRFRYLAAPIVDMRFRELFHIGNVGVMAVMVLPARLGELARPYLMKRQYGVSMSASLGPSAAERVIDGLVVTLGFFALTRAVAMPDAMRHAGFAALLFFLGLAGTLAIVLIWHEAGASWLRRVIALGSPRLAERVVAMAVSFAQGLAALKRPRVLMTYVAWTLAMWAINGVGNWVFFRTMHLSLPLIAGYVLAAAMVIAVMFPSGPGFVGPIEAAIVLGLSLFAIDRETAFAFSILLHAASLVVTVAFGVISLLRLQLSMATLVTESNATSPS